MKKLTCLLLVVVLVAAISVPASADWPSSVNANGSWTYFIISSGMTIQSKNGLGLVVVSIQVKSASSEYGYASTLPKVEKLQRDNHAASLYAADVMIHDS